MSVPKSERGESKVEFLNQLRKLEVLLLRINAKAPKKFNYFMNNFLIKPAADAYSDAKAGNTIYVMTEQDVQMRRKCMLSALINLSKISSQVDVYYEIYKSTFLTNNELQEIYSTLSLCYKLVKGVIKSDSEKGKRIMKKRIEDEEKMRTKVKEQLN